MAYDRVRVLDPIKKKVESFVTRISREDVTAWLLDRAELAEAGFPDRPPDVVLPTMRTWVRHPGEEHHAFFQQNEDLDGFAVETIRWDYGADLSVACGLSWDHDHYAIGVAGTGERAAELHWPKGAIHDADGIRAERVFPPDAAEDDVWAEFERAVAAFAEAGEGEADVTVNTYLDFELLAQEVALAKADIARGFAPTGTYHD